MQLASGVDLQYSAGSHTDGAPSFPEVHVSSAQKTGILATVVLLVAALAHAADTESVAQAAAMPWWGWAIVLFFFSLLLGIVAALGGVGGGVLFVPIVSALFPFHLDYVRGAGLMVALFGALSAAPTFLKRRLASLRLAIPLSLVGSVASIAGAMVGLALPVYIVEVSLGVVVISVVALMLRARSRGGRPPREPDALSSALAIHGVYYDEHHGGDVEWNVHRFAIGLLAFAGIGFLGGVFGIGAGWANVPALNLMLGAPLKISVATSGLIISINGTAAGWIYLHRQAVLPLIAVPSVAGIMIGTRVGAAMLGKARPEAVRWLVIGILLLAGVRSILSGSGVM